MINRFSQFRKASEMRDILRLYIPQMHSQDLSKPILGDQSCLLARFGASANFKSMEGTDLLLSSFEQVVQDLRAVIGVFPGMHVHFSSSGDALQATIVVSPAIKAIRLALRIVSAFQVNI